ncbi:MAG: hypothetical protein Q9201_005479 [Fulgogasparrea decipioides]
MAPHLMETILRPPQWPAALSSFVTWCLMWDPCNRPTSAQAMKHEYFADAVDPLRPKSSTSRFLGRKQYSSEGKQHRDSVDGPQLSSKPSWFRKSLISKDSVPALSPSGTAGQASSSRPSPIHANTVAEPPITTSKSQQFASKRATWTNSTVPAKGAPMPILPSIRPISPFSDAVTAQANIRATDNADTHPTATTEAKASKKIGRQLSVASNGNHYGDCSRQEAEKALNGARDVMSPGGTQKEGFFSHLRKRARRLSGRPQAPTSPTPHGMEANAGCSPWQSNRGSVNYDSGAIIDPMLRNEMSPGEIEKALQSPSYVVGVSPSPSVPPSHKSSQYYVSLGSHPVPERQPSLTKARAPEGAPIQGAATPISGRTRRALQHSTNPSQMYETPDEEDELLHEALYSASKAAKGMDRRSRAEGQRTAMAYKDVSQHSMQHSAEQSAVLNPYPTPSPSAKGSGTLYNQNLLATPAQPLNINRSRPKEDIAPRWPTPPYEENEWAAAAAASIFAAGSIYQ